MVMVIARDRGSEHDYDNDNDNDNESGFESHSSTTTSRTEFPAENGQCLQAGESTPRL